MIAFVHGLKRRSCETPKNFAPVGPVVRVDMGAGDERDILTAPTLWGTRMRNIVNGMFIRNGLVLLARRSPQRRAYPDVWSFPGGHVDEGETLEQALLRELSEELAVLPTAYRLIDTIVDPNAEAIDPITYYMYVVTAWDGGEPTIIDDEHTKLSWFVLEDAAVLSDLALDEYRSLFKKLAAA
jgi:8-oxo-dGTP diphosphatase